MVSSWDTLTPRLCVYESLESLPSFLLHSFPFLSSPFLSSCHFSSLWQDQIPGLWQATCSDSELHPHLSPFSSMNTNSGWLVHPETYCTFSSLNSYFQMELYLGFLLGPMNVWGKTATSTKLLGCQTTIHSSLSEAEVAGVLVLLLFLCGFDYFTVYSTTIIETYRIVIQEFFKCIYLNGSNRPGQKCQL